MARQTLIPPNRALVRKRTANVAQAVAAKGVPVGATVSVANAQHLSATPTDLLMVTKGHHERHVSHAKLAVNCVSHAKLAVNRVSHARLAVNRVSAAPAAGTARRAPPHQKAPRTEL